MTPHSASAPPLPRPAEVVGRRRRAGAVLRRVDAVHPQRDHPLPQGDHPPHRRDDHGRRRPGDDWRHRRRRARSPGAGLAVIAGGGYSSLGNIGIEALTGFLVGVPQRAHRRAGDRGYRAGRHDHPARAPPRIWVRYAGGRRSTPSTAMAVHSVS